MFALSGVCVCVRIEQRVCVFTLSGCCNFTKVQPLHQTVSAGARTRACVCLNIQIFLSKCV